jgi:hypothetical protein
LGENLVSVVTTEGGQKIPDAAVESHNEKEVEKAERIE